MNLAEVFEIYKWDTNQHRFMSILSKTWIASKVVAALQVVVLRLYSDAYQFM